MISPFILLVTFIVGLLIGSFLNVVGLRFLREESIVFPPSRCYQCDNPIQPWDNIPVLSYCVLGGRCRHCKARISIQYPLVELLTAFLFTVIVAQHGFSFYTLFLLFFVVNLIVITITDLRESYIFQINSLPLIPAGLVMNAFELSGLPGWGGVTQGLPVTFGPISWVIPPLFVSALIGVAGAFLFFEGMILFSEWAFGTEGFGHGDTHLMMGVGAYLGWELGLLSLILGFAVQAVVAVPVMVYQWFKRKDYVSIAAGFASFLFGVLPLWILNWPDGDLTTKRWLILLCVGLTCVGMLVFLKRAKSAQTFTYLPLGPALIVGTLISLFWGRELIAGYQVMMGLH